MDPTTDKPQFSGHETFPCRYGWLKKSFDASFSATDGINPFAPEVGVVEFGVGRNMVASMRHWALAHGVLGIAEGRQQRALVPTDLGRLIFGPSGDPHLETSASLWTLHWTLVRSAGRAACWYVAFNEFEEAVFTKASLLQRLEAKAASLRPGTGAKAGRVSGVTLARDVDCLIRSYVARSGRVTEDSLESPLSELRLISRSALGSGAFEFARGAKPTLPDAVFVTALADFWRLRHPTRRTMTLGAVAHDPGSPGRALLLDEGSVVERLERVEETSEGLMSWDEGSGLRQVSLRRDLWEDPLHLLRPLYGAGARRLS